MNICIFGDSIVWGASDHEKGGWVERIKTYCMENHEDVEVYNLGVSGDNTDDLLNRVESEAKAREADLIIFAIGSNDSQYIEIKSNRRVSPERFEDNLTKLSVIARDVTDKVIFVGLAGVDESKTMPIPWNPKKYYDNEGQDRYNEIITSFCRGNGFKYVDIGSVIGIDDLEDGLHPNSRGHGKIFEVVLKELKEYLKDEA